MSIPSPQRGPLPGPLTASRVRRARLATFFGFFQLGAMIVIWSTSTSALRVKMGWGEEGGDTSFGMLALAIGIGAAVGGFAIGPLLDRFGPRMTTTATLVLCPLCYIPLAFVGSVAGAIVVGVTIGLTRGAQDTAVNAHGMLVERFYGRSIMSAFHAAYPAGGFIFGLIGAAFARRFTDSPAVVYTSMGILLAVLGLLAGRWMLAKSERFDDPSDASSAVVDHEETAEKLSGRSSAAVTTIAIMVGFGVLLLCSQLSEGGVLDWGQEFVRRHFSTTASFAAVAVSVYSGSEFVGRLFGDRIAEKIGPRLLVSLSGVVGAVGGLVTLLGPGGASALIGFALIGAGLSCISPMLLSAAGRRDPANAGRNIGIVNSLGYSGMLIGPAAITLIVDKFGISAMPALSIVLLVAVAIAAPTLMKAVRGYEAPPANRTEDQQVNPCDDPDSPRTPQSL